MWNFKTQCGKTFMSDHFYCEIVCSILIKVCHNYTFTEYKKWVIQTYLCKLRFFKRSLMPNLYVWYFALTVSPILVFVNKFVTFLHYDFESWPLFHTNQNLYMYFVVSF